MEDSCSSPVAIELVKRWEGLHKVKEDGLVYPYLCPAGVWTIGYGSTRHFDGTRITNGTSPLSPEECERLMLLELDRCTVRVLRESPILALYPEACGAITSFVFNLGIGAYRASTLKKKIDEGDFEEAQNQIKRWVWAGGRRLPGLVARREQESQYLVESIRYSQPEDGLYPANSTG